MFSDRFCFSGVAQAVSRHIPWPTEAFQLFSRRLDPYCIIALRREKYFLDESDWFSSSLKFWKVVASTPMLKTEERT